MIHDFRFAFRQLVKTPGFTIIAVLTLALAIGVNSAVFALINGVVLRPTVRVRPAEVVNVFSTRQNANHDYRQFSHAEYQALRASSDRHFGRKGIDVTPDRDKRIDATRPALKENRFDDASDEVLERAGIAHLGDRLVGKCSGGEQQRLRFALALLPDPALMVLDEPTAGMDVEGRRDFWNAIRQDAKRGRTVLFATHYLEEADAYADRIVLLRRGHIVADGTAAEVRNHSSGRSVQASLAAADRSTLAGLPGVRSVEIRGERVIIQTTESDAVARYAFSTSVWLAARSRSRRSGNSRRHGS
jgi:ABC-type sugar transport system ATPase subunit